MKPLWLLLTLTCLNGFASAETPLNLTLYKSPSAEKESISVHLENITNSPVQFKSLSLQQFINNEWVLFIYDISCPCLAKCNAVTTVVEPKNSLSLDFNFSKLGCGKVEKGRKYRAIAQGAWNKENSARVFLGKSEPFVANQ